MEDLVALKGLDPYSIFTQPCADTRLLIRNVRGHYALTSIALKKGGLSTGDVAALYKYKNSQFDVKVDTDSNISTTLTFTEILPSAKTIASFKVPDYNSGKG